MSRAVFLNRGPMAPNGATRSLLADPEQQPPHLMFIISLFLLPIILL